VFELLYGGSKGSMKSHYLIISPLEILELAQRKWEETGVKQRKCRVMCFRRNLEDIKDLVAKSFELYPVFDPEMGTDGFHVKDKFWEFSSGATVEFRHLDGPTDHEGYQGNEFVALLFDEVQYISYEAYSFLVAQVRSSDPDYRALCMVRSTANPGGPHGDWVKRHFHIDECPQGGRIFEEKVKLRNGREMGVTRAFIRGYLKDNPFLDPDGSYEANLRANMSPEQVRMYLDGDFDVVSGAFFAHLLQPSIHFVRSTPIPGNWDMLHTTDWGSSAPACTLWLARDNDGAVHVIDELHRPGITGRNYGEAMKEKYKHQKWSSDRTWRVEDFWGVIDTQAMDRYGSDATAAAGIMEHGFRIFGADKNPGERAVGINQIKERLLMDRFGKPRILIYSDRCPNLVKALKGIQSKPLDPDDYDPGSAYAHAIDSLRFGLMKWSVSRPDDRDQRDVELERWMNLARSRSTQTDDGSISGYG
jgi:hypothetical protein